MLPQPFAILDDNTLDLPPMVYGLYYAATSVSISENTKLRNVQYLLAAPHSPRTEPPSIDKLSKEKPQWDQFIPARL